MFSHPSREEVLDRVHGVTAASSYLVPTICNTVGYMLSILFFFFLIRRIGDETEKQIVIRLGEALDARLRHLVHMSARFTL